MRHTLWPLKTARNVVSSHFSAQSSCLDARKATRIEYQRLQARCRLLLLRRYQNNVAAPDVLEDFDLWVPAPPQARQKLEN